MCFPNGIKLCFCDKEADLKPSQEFYTVITNEAGEQRYLTIFSFYSKYDALEFEDFFGFNPIKDYFKITKNLELIENSKSESQRKTVEKKLKKNLEICTNFINNPYIYSPNALCLVSKFPFVKQTEKCLESLFKIYADTNSQQKEINSLLIHLINEIPLPPPSKNVFFYVPYSLNPIELPSFLNKDLPCNSFDVTRILDFLSAENFSLIFFLILFEQKILFISDNFNLLSEIILSFAYLIYPFEWINVLIPILSEELVKYLQCFRPFIMGIDESMIETAKQFIEEDQCVYLVNIKKDTIENYTKKKLKKSTRKSISVENNKALIPKEEGQIPNIPDEVFSELKKEIGNLKSLNEKHKKNKKAKTGDLEKVQIKLKKVCIKLLAFIFGEYKKYVTFIDKTPIFDIKAFVSLKPALHSSFYEEITSTHIFKYFLQSTCEDIFPYFEKLCLRYSNHTTQDNSASKRPILSKNTIYSHDKKSLFKKLVSFNLNNSGSKESRAFSKNTSSRASKKASILDVNIPNKKQTQINLKQITVNSHENIYEKNNSNNNNNKNNILINHSNKNFNFDFPSNNHIEKDLAKSPNISVSKYNLGNESLLMRNSDSCSYSNSKSENTENNKNPGESDNYIILPYFINSLLNSEISKIEFFISEKIKSKATAFFI